MSSAIEDFPSEGSFYEQMSWGFEYLPMILLEMIALLGLAVLFGWLRLVKAILKPGSDTGGTSE